METNSTTMKLYSLAVLLYKRSGGLDSITVATCYRRAVSSDEAVGNVYKTYCLAYPLEDGWNSPIISAIEIPAEFWKEIDEINGN